MSNPYGEHSLGIQIQGLLRKYGSRVRLAEAWILGDIASRDEDAICSVVDSLTLEVARIRLKAAGLLTPEHIHVAVPDKNTR